jgi:hypothetical protein
MPLLGSWRCPGAAISAPSATGIGGPQLQLRPTLGLEARMTRGRYLRLDGDGARPSAVVLLGMAGCGSHSLHRPWIRNFVIYTIRL